MPRATVARAALPTSLSSSERREAKRAAKEAELRAHAGEGRVREATGGTRPARTLPARAQRVAQGQRGRERSRDEALGPARSVASESVRAGATAVLSGASERAARCVLSVWRSGWAHQEGMSEARLAVQRKPRRVRAQRRRLPALSSDSGVAQDHRPAGRESLVRRARAIGARGGRYRPAPRTGSRRERPSFTYFFDLLVFADLASYGSE